MGDKTFVNGMAAVHKGSAGQALAFPDVCLCPPAPPAGPIPTPLPNAVKASDLDGGAATVLIEGNPAGKLSSFLKQSTGNEVARSTGGGVVSHTVQGKAHFVNGSPNVFFEGEPAVRHLDMLTHNHLAPQPGNTPPAVWLSTMRPPLPAAPPAGQRKKLKEGTSWISVRVVDYRGDAAGLVRYELITPKGGKLTGALAGQGKAMALNLAPGSCKLSLPDVDKAFKITKNKSHAQPPAGSKPYLPGQSLTLEAGKEHVVSIPGRDLWVSFKGKGLTDRKREEDFLLRADDGSYEVTRSLTDQLEHGLEGTILRFPCVTEGPTYTLVHRRQNEVVHEVFAERSFTDLFPEGKPAVAAAKEDETAPRPQRTKADVSPELEATLRLVRAERLARQAAYDAEPDELDENV